MLKGILKGQYPNLGPEVKYLGSSKECKNHWKGFYIFKSIFL